MTGLLRATLVAVPMLGAACSARAGGELHLYNWTDYTSPALIAKFEKETGVRVTVDTYDSNETLLAKLKSGAGGYDIVVVSSDFVPIFIADKLIQKIEAATMPGFANIEARWQRPTWDKGNDYTIPFDWGVTAFDINTKYVTGPVDSLKTLFEPPAAAKDMVGMLGAPSEVISLAELYLGLSPCETDVAAMKKVSALLEGQGPFVKVYNSDGIIERESSGETWIHQIWNGDAARARDGNPDVKFIFPKEGVVGWMDDLAIPAGASDPDNARLFLQFMLKPENSALSTDFTHYSSPIAGSDAYLDPKIRDAPELKVPADTKIVFTPTCQEPAIRLMDRVWTKLRR